MRGTQDLDWRMTPRAFLFSRSSAFYVVEDDSALTLQPVSGDVVITSGVEEGAKIVALSVQNLDSGQRVRIVSSLSF
jgi:hypothetical protein